MQVHRWSNLAMTYFLISRINLRDLNSYLVVKTFSQMHLKGRVDKSLIIFGFQGFWINFKESLKILDTIVVMKQNFQIT